MQFKNPEILYALLLLVIPIIVHLFQLRRFIKVDFTNVQALKNISLKTRRSSQIKKWITLFTRLILLACLIIAFAQPYQATDQYLDSKTETVIYLDNSFSMQVRGSNGSLLNSAIQDLITYIEEDKKITLFTNDQTFSNTTIKSIKGDLIKLAYSASQLDYEAALLKGKKAFSNDPKSFKNFILISDFQQKQKDFPSLTDSLISNRMVQLLPKELNNISIDSLYISKRTNETLELTVNLSNQGKAVETLPIALYNKDQLISKSAVDIKDKAETIFTIPNNTSFKGKVSIDDPKLIYDNSLYFSLNENNRIKVLAIYDLKSDVEFLKRLYTEDEFDLTLVTFDQLNYNSISDQHLIVLNALKSIPNALITSLSIFSEDGGSVLIIPSSEADTNSYSELFTRFSLPKFTSRITTEKRITEINFSHPILANVFEEKVDNFQYPKVNSLFALSRPASSIILRFEDNSPFLFHERDVYAFSAALQEDNSNFKNSPLIVPILYNIGKNSLKSSQLYYVIGQKNVIDFNITLQQDEILKLTNQDESFIPMQQTFSQKVQLTTDETPKTAGIYAVKHKDSELSHLSYNYDREESKLRYIDFSDEEPLAENPSIASVMDTLKSNTNVKELWKWFVIFAVAFLIIEMLILKFLK